MARSSTTFPRKWSSGKTTVIRVPESLAVHLLEIARRLDGNCHYALREEGTTLVLELQVPSAPVSYELSKPINVSCVPQRSPFRYPGGKTWLVPYIRDWLKWKKPTPARLIEPFAGGAIVSLTAAFERLAKHVIFAEMDEGVGAVWRVVLNGHSEWLANEILKFDLTVESAVEALRGEPTDLKRKAFQTLLRNRVQRGGILAPGAGLVKTGENGRGIKSRWYPETLARRIREINNQKDRLTFVQGDGLPVIDEHLSDRDAVFYIDPPYTVAARRLYSVWEIDHAALFDKMAQCKGDFLMSYDNTGEIMGLARKHGLACRPVAMKNTHHAKMTELLIGRDLRWLKE